MTPRFSIALAFALSALGCTRPASGPAPLVPSASMPLATVETTGFVTGVPAGWTIHFQGPRMLKAFDPGSQSRTSTSTLEFVVQTPTHGCEGERIMTNEGPSCLRVKQSHGEAASVNAVSIQTPAHVLRIYQSIGDLEKPVPISELRKLALRIINTYAPPPAPALSESKTP